MSHVVINEDQSSTEQKPSSYDEETKPIEQVFLHKAIDKIARSKDKTDKRFIDIYRTSQARRYGVIYNDFRDFLVEEGADSQFSQASQLRLADENTNSNISSQ